MLCIADAEIGGNSNAGFERGCMKACLKDERMGRNKERKSNIKVGQPYLES